MAKTVIKVKYGGCGIKYADNNGVTRHALKTPEDGPFTCEIEQAERLVNLGVAEYVVTTETGKPAVQPDDDTLTAEKLEAMTNKQLDELAGELGLDVKGCKKKADYIAVILAAEVEPEGDPDGDNDPDGNPDGDNDPDGDPDNKLPDLNPADPE